MADEQTESKSEDSKDKDGAEGASKLRSVHTTTLPQLLDQLGISVAITTYQAGKVIIARPDGGKLNTHFRNFHTPMGMCLSGNRLALGTHTDVWELVNQPDVAPKIKPEGKHDACYLPRVRHTTGNIGIHEIAWVGKQLCIVNTRFSCLCTLDPDSSFVPTWRPHFVSGLASEDRCHLNGLGLRDGRPKYVTALGETDSNAGWRANKARGGVLMDVDSNEFICRGLSMPHSPRWYDNKLWVLESGAGSISLVDQATGALQHVAMLPGFTRGIDFFGPFAFVGLSQVRESAVFSGIPITERLPKPEDRTCGMYVVDLRNGQIVAFLRFEEGVQEIFSVLVMRHRFPELLNEQEEEIANSFMLPDDAMRDVVQPTPPPPELAEAAAKEQAESAG